jgi:lipopolysaccharide transport system ATP-binding protein
VARGEGRTVLFVSHNMAAVEGLCSSAILLSGGRVLASGATHKMIQEYLSDISRGAAIPLDKRADRQGSGAVRFTSVSLSDGCGQSLVAFRCGAASTLVLQVENTSGRELRNVHFSVGLDNSLGQRVLLLDSTLLGEDVARLCPGAGAIRIAMPRLSLLPGRYHFTLYSMVNGSIADWIKNAGFFEVEGGDYYGTGQLPPGNQGYFAMDHGFHYAPAPVESSRATAPAAC